MTIEAVEAIETVTVVKGNSAASAVKVLSSFKHFKAKLEQNFPIQTQCNSSKRVSISFVFIFMQCLNLNF